MAIVYWSHMAAIQAFSIKLWKSEVRQQNTGLFNLQNNFFHATFRHIYINNNIANKTPGTVDNYCRVQKSLGTFRMATARSQGHISFQTDHGKRKTSLRLAENQYYVSAANSVHHRTELSLLSTIVLFAPTLW